MLNKLENVEVVQGDVKRVIPLLARGRMKFDRIVMARPQLKETFLEDAFKGRHLVRQLNVGFVDGHVDRMRADDMGADPDNSREYRNRTPLWRPRKSIPYTKIE